MILSRAVLLNRPNNIKIEPDRGVTGDAIAQQNGNLLKYKLFHSVDREKIQNNKCNDSKQ